MTSPSQPLAASAAGASLQHSRQRCRHCGGSGILRRGDQSFRTCLDCLGQGESPLLGVGQGLIGLIEGRWPSRLSEAINATPNASASR
ncbi:MAG: hypothetical protein ACOVNL_10530 [Prochlorococcaceae cyanobacterium]|jgi:hypothetical protein